MGLLVLFRHENSNYFSQYAHLRNYQLSVSALQ
jgi:hypothetical protein